MYGVNKSFNQTCLQLNIKLKRSKFHFLGINEIKEANEAHKANLEKCIEEEREERLSQNTELLDKIDKEKRDRSSGLAELKHKLEDEQDELKKEVLAGQISFKISISDCAFYNHDFDH